MAENGGAITNLTRSMADVEQYCEICGKPITPASVAVLRFPKVGPVLEADFRPHELKFRRVSE